MEHVFSCAFASAFILQEKKFVAKKKIVHDPYVSAGPLSSALPIPLLALWVFAGMVGGGPAGGHRAACCKLAPASEPAGRLWVIWVIWVIVLNCMAMHAVGSFGSLFLHSPNDPKGADLAPKRFGVFGSFGSFCHRIKIGAGCDVLHGA